MSDAHDRAVRFMRGMDQRQAERSVRTPHGVAHFAATVPRVWYRNFLAVDLGTRATAGELAIEAEMVQAPALLEHRKVVVDDDLGKSVARDFVGRGWRVEENVVMAHERDDVPLDLASTTELTADDLVPIWRAGIRETTPDEESVRQLVESQLGRRHAVGVRYFGAHAEGRIAAYCELFVEDGVGQIESVMCLRGFRGRGLGKAVVARALAESLAVHDLTFLVADANDWPKELYRRLGFEEVGRTWEFIREPQR